MSDARGCGEDAAGCGCIFAIAFLAAIFWLPLHWSGKSFLYYRSEEAVMDAGLKSTFVTCHYFSSTGTEQRSKLVGFPSGYYCPRYRDVGS